MEEHGGAWRSMEEHGGARRSRPGPGEESDPPHRRGEVVGRRPQGQNQLINTSSVAMTAGEATSTVSPSCFTRLLLPSLICLSQALVHRRASASSERCYANLSVAAALTSGSSSLLEDEELRGGGSWAQSKSGAIHHHGDGILETKGVRFPWDPVQEGPVPGPGSDVPPLPQRPAPRRAILPEVGGADPVHSSGGL